MTLLRFFWPTFSLVLSRSTSYKSTNSKILLHLDDWSFRAAIEIEYDLNGFCELCVVHQYKIETDCVECMMSRHQIMFCFIYIFIYTDRYVSVHNID